VTGSAGRAIFKVFLALAPALAPAFTPAPAAVATPTVATPTVDWNNLKSVDAEIVDHTLTMGLRYAPELTEDEQRYLASLGRELFILTRGPGNDFNREIFKLELARALYVVDNKLLKPNQQGQFLFEYLRFAQTHLPWTIHDIVTHLIHDFDPDVDFHTINRSVRILREDINAISRQDPTLNRVSYHLHRTLNKSCDRLLSLSSGQQSPKL